MLVSGVAKASPENPRSGLLVTVLEYDVKIN